MPMKPRRPCRYPGCVGFCEQGQVYCPEHIKWSADRLRGGAAYRGYDRKWREVRAAYVGDNQSIGEVLIDSESVNVVMNGSKYSRFAGNYVQFGNCQLRRTTDGGLAFKMTDI